MQVMWTLILRPGKTVGTPGLPDQFLPELLWGGFDSAFNTRRGAGQAWQHGMLRTYENLRLSRNLAEELAASRVSNRCRHLGRR